MKITTAPAQKHRWAKRSFSIVMCAAMLLTGLVFANTMTASAFLQADVIGPVSPPGGFTFVVPETIYMTPAQTGGGAPAGQICSAQYFLNNKMDGTAVQNDTDAGLSEGKFYIGHSNAVKYELFYGNNGAAPTRVLEYDTQYTGELWTFTVNGGTEWLKEPVRSLNTSVTREWQLKFTFKDGTTKTLHNYTVLYQPNWVPSQYSTNFRRGANNNAARIDQNMMYLVNGLHLNWGVFGSPNARKQHNPTSTYNAFFPLLGLLRGENAGSDSFSSDDTSATGVVMEPHTNVLAGASNLSAKQVQSAVLMRDTAGTSGTEQFDANHWYNLTAGNGYSANPANNNNAYTQNHLNLTSAASQTNANRWGLLRIDTSRNTTFRGIPNFSLMWRTTWIGNDHRLTGYAASTSPSGSVPRSIFKGYTGSASNQSADQLGGATSGTTAGVNDPPNSVNISTNGISTGRYTVTTDRELLNNMPVHPTRDHEYFWHQFEMNSPTTTDWWRLRVIWRIETPKSSKEFMRNKIYNSIWAGRCEAGDAPALKNVIGVLGDPTQAANDGLVGWGDPQRPDAASGIYNIRQSYVFRNNGNLSPRTINGDGSAVPFTLAGESYVTPNFSTTKSNVVSNIPANYLVRIMIPLVGEQFSGYVYSHSTINGGPVTESIMEKITDSNTAVVHYYDPITYEVKYDANGGTGTAMPNSTHSFNTAKNLTANTYTKLGYDFLGWSLSKSATAATYLNSGPTNSVVNLSNKQDAVVTLYAVWAPKTLSVIYDTGIGFNPATPATNLVEFGARYDKLAPLATAAQPGYDFDGWFTSAAGGTQVRNTTIVTNPDPSHTVYAHWTAKKFNALLNVNATDADPLTNFRIPLTFGGVYPALPTPTRTGYRFVDWSTVQNDVDSDSDTYLDNRVVVNDPVVIPNEHTLYAQWEAEEYTVTFDAAGGDNLSNPTIQVKFGEHYNFITPLAAVDPAAGMGAFLGWYTDDGTLVTDSDTVAIAGNHKLTAKFAGVVAGLNYNPMGGTFTEDPGVKSGLVLGEPYGFLSTPTKPGFSFGGWWTSADNGITLGTLVEATTPVTNIGTHYVYAKWDPKDFTITFDPNGGELTVPADKTKTVVFNTAYGTLPAVTRTGYTFVEWQTAKTGGTPVTDLTIMDTPNSHTVYAIWAPINSTVTFDLNYPSAPAGPAGITAEFDAAYGKHATPVNTLPTPTRFGYVFDYWWTDRVAGTKVSAATKVTEVTNHSVYAHWVPIPITVSFEDPIGGNLTTTKKVALATEYGPLPSVTRTGYNFTGWWTVPGGTGTLVEETTLVDAAATDHSLYAGWEAMDDIQVTLDLNGGTELQGASPVPVFDVTFAGSYGANVNQIPIRTGYIFLGWSAIQNDPGAALNPPVLVNEISATSTVTNAEPHTLYAQWEGVSVLVTFTDLMRSETPTPATITVVVGSAYGSLATISNTSSAGYDFAGWFADPTGGTEVKAIDLVPDTLGPVGAQELYARWTPKELKVTFDANGGTPVTDDVTVTYGGNYPALPTFPKRTGYTCNGWFDAPTGGNLIAAGTPLPATVTDNHILYAQWTANSVLVTLDVNGSDIPLTPNTKTVTFDDEYGAASVLPVPIYGGHAFKGWWTAATGGTRVKDTTKVTNAATHTLFAHWEEAGTPVTLNYNDGGARSDKSIEVPFGGTYGAAVANPGRKGYTFDGWYTVASGGTSAQMVDELTTVTNPVAHTLWAYWTIVKCDVTFNENHDAGTATTVNIQYGEAYDTYLPSPDPTRAGYIFDGWWTDPVYGSKLKAGTAMEREADHTFYAHWTPVKYDVTFDKNAADATAPNPLTKEVTVDQTSYGVLAETTRPGYVFAGWWTTDGVAAGWNPVDGTATAEDGVQITRSSKVTNPAAHTLFARWKAAGLKLTFDGNGGTPNPASKIVTFDQPYGALATAIRRGYVQDGWHTLAVGGTPVTELTTVTETEAHTIYAHWTTRTDIEVTLDSNGGDAIAPASGVFDVTFDAAYPAGAGTGVNFVPTRTGYSFAGWYTKPTGGTLVDNATVVSNSEDHTLYARWTANTYTLDFVDTQAPLLPNPPSTTVTFGKAYGTLPAMPVKAGYTFVGWYDAASGGAKVESTNTVSTTIDPITLYAYWTENTVGVLFDYNYDGAPASPTRLYPGGPATTYDDGNEGTMPADTDPGFPVRTGYTFGGWYVSKTGGTPVLSTDLVVPTVTRLYARWNGKPQVVTYQLQGGAFVSPAAPAATTVTYGSKYGTLEAVKRDGHDFAGWWTTDGTVTPEDGVPVTKDSIVSIDAGHDLFARWTAINYTLTFNGNGGTPPASKTITYDKPYGYDPMDGSTQLLPEATRTGYNFLGWSSTRDDGTLANEVVETDIVAVLKNQTLYAQWEAKDDIVVSFNANGGAPAPADIIVTFDTAYDALPNGPLPVVTKANSDFMGWWTAAAGGTEVKGKDIVENPDNHMLYARWDTKVYGVYFDPNGGAGDLLNWEGAYIEEGQPYGALPPYPSRPGYTCLGWFTAATGGTQVTETTLVPVGATATEHTLYAQWSAPKIYTVTFDSDGGSVPSPVSKQVTFDTAYGELPAVTRKGYTFTGWWTVKGTGGKQITKMTVLNAAIMSDPANHTLYARWKADGSQPTTQPGTKYQLSVRGGPGSGEYEAGTKVQIIANGLPAGTKFVAWVILEGNVTIADRKASTTTITTMNGDAVVAATYTDADGNVYTAGTKYTLTVRGGPGSGEYEGGTQVQITASNVPEGKVFASWVVEEGSAKIADPNAAATTVTVTGDAVIAATYKAADEGHCRCYNLHDHNVGLNHNHRWDHINSFWGKVGCFFCRFWHGTLRWIFFGWIWM